MAISMLKIRRPLGRLIFNMGIAIPGKTVFLIETAPRTGILHTSQAFHDDITMLEMSEQPGPLRLTYEYLT